MSFWFVNKFCTFFSWKFERGVQYLKKITRLQYKNNCDITFIILRSKVDGDVMDAVDTGQVYPPGGGL